MLFDIEDYKYYGFIGNKYVPEVTLKNLPIDELLITQYAVREGIMNSAEGYFHAAVGILPLNKRNALIDAWFNFLDKYRIVAEMSNDRQIESGDFWHMMYSSKIIPNSDGTYPFAVGESLSNCYVTDVPEGATSAGLYFTQIGDLTLDPTDPNYGYNGDNLQKINGEIPSDSVAYSTESGWYKFIPFNETVYNEYLTAVEELAQSLKSLMTSGGEEIIEN